MFGWLAIQNYELKPKSTFNHLHLREQRQMATLKLKDNIHNLNEDCLFKPFHISELDEVMHEKIY